MLNLEDKFHGVITWSVTGQRGDHPKLVLGNLQLRNEKIVCYEYKLQV